MPSRPTRPESRLARIDRRQFLSSAAGAVALAGPLQALLARGPSAGAGRRLGRSAGYGPLVPARDEATGLPLLAVPADFRYTTFGWTGDRMTDGQPTPGAHDGMAAFPGASGRVLLVRNHELGGDDGALRGRRVYDRAAEGGTTTLEFDTLTGTLVSSRASLSGTLRNCAGGPTPWGSWLTCEETVAEPTGDNHLLRRHGYVFEVPAAGAASAQPLMAMGRFVHEAIAVDPATGIVYLTEDNTTAGFYRFQPRVDGDLAAGGTLEMLAVEGRPQFDTRRGHRAGLTVETTWVPIRDPQKVHSGSAPDGLGVFRQGLAAGGAVFARLEGAWFGAGRVYFDATSGGSAGKGQIWEYTPAAGLLRLVFESPSADVLDMPDNLCVSPRGGLTICEDGLGPQYIHGLTPDGELFPFVRNDVRLNGERHRLAGDFSMREFAGSCYSPDGQWLFFNIQSPGITVAMTGPWGTVGL